MQKKIVKMIKKSDPFVLDQTVSEKETNFIYKGNAPNKNAIREASEG